MTLEESINHHFPEDQHQEEKRILAEFCQKWIVSGLADSDADKRLRSMDKSVFWSQLSEALVAKQLAKVGLVPEKNRRAEGPDFLIMHKCRRIWVEVITPEPRGLPRDYPKLDGGWHSFPSGEILLRWTAAIKEKTEKLLGIDYLRTGNISAGYRQKGIVCRDDIYVIAVNSVLLGGSFSEGSDYPFSAKATLGIGDRFVQFCTKQHKAVSAGWNYSPVTQNNNNASVRTDLFFDRKIAPVSAVWGGAWGLPIALGDDASTNIVHNPFADNALPPDLLPAQAEYVATITKQGEATVERRKGQLAP